MISRAWRRTARRLRLGPHALESSAEQIDAGSSRHPHGSADARPCTPVKGVRRVLIVLSPAESQRDVTARAQMVAADAQMSEVFLLQVEGWAAAALAGLWQPRTRRNHGWRVEPTRDVPELLFPRAEIHSIHERNKEALAAFARHDDLVVVGRQRVFPWLLSTLGWHVRSLIRRTHAPILVVGSQPRGHYRRALIAADPGIDFSGAIALAERLAPDAERSLIHVYRAPLEGKLRWGAASEQTIVRHRLDAQLEAAAAMTAAVTDTCKGRQLRVLLTHGFTVPRLLQKARDLQSDLLIVTRRRRSAFSELLCETVSLAIAARASCDVLVVNETGARETIDAQAAPRLERGLAAEFGR